MLSLLELRLDNVVYRAGFASTRAEARQLVSHGHILVDDKRVNIASFSLKTGQVVSLHQKAKKHLRVASSIALAKQKPEVTWLNVSESDMTAAIIEQPALETLHGMFKVNNVVELYSK